MCLDPFGDFPFNTVINGLSCPLIPTACRIPKAADSSSVLVSKHPPLGADTMIQYVSLYSGGYQKKGGGGLGLHMRRIIVA